MKKFVLVLLMCFPLTTICQKSLISYDDIKYLLHNNINEADTFLAAKGYFTIKKDNNTKNRKYSLKFHGGTQNVISLRYDGKRLFIELETNDINQYDVIRESISQYLIKDGMAADIQTYQVKDLGNIYIMVNDTMPYDPLKRDYDIQIVGDKHITAYN
ncbi:MAG TPA: hypothetical protein VHA56_02845 [Mucilaginibacter sp.]|nr:hypothetical protein [Mucilaginibacter sp.]